METIRFYLYDEEGDAVWPHHMEMPAVPAVGHFINYDAELRIPGIEDGKPRALNAEVRRVEHCVDVEPGHDEDSYSVRLYLQRIEIAYA